MSDDTISLARDGDVAVVTIDSPATMNALSAGAARKLSRTLDQAAEDCRAILLTGAGSQAFCTGADLSSSPDAHWIDAKGRLDSSFSIQEVFNPLATRMRNLRVPVVTAVCGAAAGFGCTLALLGDMVVAGESAYFMQAFRRVGLVPDGGSTYLLTRLLGKARAMEMVLMGGKITANKAFDWGLVNRLVPDSEVRSTAAQIALELAKDPYSMGLIRRLIWEGLDATWQEQVHRESLAQRDAAFSADFGEGLAAFKEKRPPLFKGR